MAQPVNSIPPSVHRGTNRHDGWREVFSPRSGTMAYLTYARLMLSPKVQNHTIPADDREWALFNIRGLASVCVGGATFELGPRDLLYVPRGVTVEVRSAGGADIALGGSPSDRDADPHLVRFRDLARDPTRVIDVGSSELHTKRTIYSMLDTRVKCSRLLAGFTVGSPGAWTSWPPHEHNDSKEEFYLFFDMPAPAFSTQFVYSSLDRAEFVEVVRDGDCVAIPSGYHPTAAAPGFSTVFMWCMAAYDPDRHRDLKYGITIQPEYQDIKFL